MSDKDRDDVIFSLTSFAIVAFLILAVCGTVLAWKYMDRSEWCAERAPWNRLQ